MFEYIVTIFKVVAGVITNERLVIASLVALGVLLLWIVFSLCFSFEMRFLSGAKKINKYISRNGIAGEQKKELYKLVQKMPSEFVRGYNTFEKNPHSLPSKFIKRSDCLDLELNGGVFNQNRSIIKSFINLVFFANVVLSFAIMSSSSLFESGATSAETALTGYMVAEALLIPFLYLFIAKGLYYIYTAIRQHQYHVAVEEFNEMIDNFDKCAMDTYGYIPSALEGGVKQEPQQVVVSGGSDVNAELIQKEFLDMKARLSAVMDSFSSSDKTIMEKLENNNDEIMAKLANNNAMITEKLAYYDKAFETVEQKIQKQSTFVFSAPTQEALTKAEVVDSDFQSENQEARTEIVVDNNNDDVLKQDESNSEPLENKTEEQKEGKRDLTSDFEAFLQSIQADYKLSQQLNKLKDKQKEMEKAQEYKDNFKPDYASLLGETEAPKRGRGRPRKEINGEEGFVIKSDKEFEEALVRAEKLMRKNEEPLSASQTKRIEKQLKELIDAMSKYKESK